MVALAVLAIALSALIQAGAQRADNVGHLRDRTVANWVATDRLTELRLEREWPSAGVREGEYDMGDRTWYWRAEIQETEQDRIRRVDMAVSSREDGEPVSRITGFIGHPEDAASGGVLP